MNETKDLLLSTLFSDKILELTILPTEQCNFRCVYCYEDFVSGRMKRKTIDSIKALLKKRASGLEHLRIGWFGGEPLLAKDIIMEISSYAMSLAKEVPDLFFDSGMSTNGYLLTPNTAKHLVMQGVKEFQITLDGPASYHDNVRSRRDGQGTFEKIWNNLLELKCSSLDFTINLRIHFSKDNIDIVTTLINDLKEKFGNDNRFRFFFKSIVPLGGKNDSSLNCFNDQESSKIIQGFQSYLGSYDSIISKKNSSYICYAGRPTSIVIRSDGRLVKCTVGLDDPENQIGYLRANGILKIDQLKIQPWFKGAVSLDRKVLRCPRAFL
jgi:uncharacterized protein